MEPLEVNDTRYAATVLLLRDPPSGREIEVFMIKRPGKGDFPDLYVFPGGKVEAADETPELCHGLNSTQADEQMGMSGALRFWVAAIRECFEECGVLLSYPVPNISATLLKGYRDRLNADELSLKQICQEQGFSLECERVKYFSYWITPKVASRRFNTRFFAAQMPAEQTALADEQETVRGLWVSPARALAAHTAGDWQMIAPTIISLESIQGFSDTTSAMAAIAKGQHLPTLTEELRGQGMQPIR